MEYKNIERTIEKYLDGKSSLEEEQELRTYFENATEIPEKYQQFKSLFLFYNDEASGTSKLQMEDITKPKKHTKTIRLAVIGLAASVALLVSVFVFTDGPAENEIYAYVDGKPVKDKELAIEETQKALLLISKNLNKGTENIGHLQEFHKAEMMLKKD